MRVPLGRLYLYASRCGARQPARRRRQYQYSTQYTILNRSKKALPCTRPLDSLCDSLSAPLARACHTADASTRSSSRAVRPNTGSLNHRRADRLSDSSSCRPRHLGLARHKGARPAPRTRDQEVALAHLALAQDADHTRRQGRRVLRGRLRLLPTRQLLRHDAADAASILRSASLPVAAFPDAEPCGVLRTRGS